jgi:hypothetical protein
VDACVTHAQALAAQIKPIVWRIHLSFCFLNWVSDVLDTIAQAWNTFMLRAVCAAIHLLICLDAVSDHCAPAVGAPRCELVNGALEAVKRVPLAGNDNVKRLVIVVPACFASRHVFSPLFSTQRGSSPGIFARGGGLAIGWVSEFRLPLRPQPRAVGSAP